MKHLLDINDLSKDEFASVLAHCRAKPSGSVLSRRGVALIFEKQSARTRNSTEMAVMHLGGHSVYIQGHELDMDVRESVEDVTRSLAGYFDILTARVYSHTTLERMAALNVRPVLNLLSDRSHPTQAVADVLTLESEFGELKGRTIAYVGDANNVARSLAMACSYREMNVRIGHPDGYGFSQQDLDVLASVGAEVSYFDNIADAVSGADAVYCDVWTSMGQEHEVERRLEDFNGFTVDETVMDLAAHHAIFMHCLPAHDGQECTRAVLESEQSRVWDQARNRMMSAIGILSFLVQENNVR